ncbi:hypothetical protein [Burkholderia ubonensis]|uniref:hypothetical protein n=1 Tax=Burkholderia ubonensis TaxID=101571 RepID=UPI000751EFFD|nr:hypothetical protein [Burkholderia ubonensis]KVP40017.1 hypothetical protein WJ87_07495 [Burkholderia ubonensis]
MLTFKMDPTTGILEVKEVLMSFTTTQTRFWYYDTKKWLKSSHGKQGDTPDRVMTDSDIRWVKQYYLPKVQPLAA